MIESTITHNGNTSERLMMKTTHNQFDIREGHFIDKNIANYLDYCTYALLAYVLTHRHEKYSKHKLLPNEQMISQALLKRFFNKNNSQMTIKKLFTETIFSEWYEIGEYSCNDNKYSSSMRLKKDKAEIANMNDNSAFMHIIIPSIREFEFNLLSNKVNKLIIDGKTVKDIIEILNTNKSTVYRIIKNANESKIKFDDTTPNILERLGLLHKGISDRSLLAPDDYDYIQYIKVNIDIDLDKFELKQSSKNMAEYWLAKAKKLINENREIPQYWLRKPTGRHYSLSPCSIQSVPSSIRGEILSYYEHTIDLDAACARYIHQLAQKHGKELKNLKLYIDNKKSTREAIAKHLNISSSNVKKILNALFFGATLPTTTAAYFHHQSKWQQNTILKLLGDDYTEAEDNLARLQFSTYFSNFYTDLKKGQKIAKEHGYCSFFEKFGGVVDKVNLPSNTKDIKKLSAYAYQGFESHFMSTLIKYHDGDFVTIHDQFYSSKPITDDILVKANAETGFEMKYDDTSEKSPYFMKRLLNYNQENGFYEQ